jgi:nucleotide-binding universal stress UspA family protein
MKSFRSILVPLDGSAFAEHALPLAGEIARRAGAILQIVHVHMPVPLLSTAFEFPVVEVELETGQRQQEAEYLGSVVARIPQASGVPITTIQLEGGIVPAIQSHVEATSVDLIVLTSHGRGAVGRAWLGSVADGLIRNTRVPILLVRPPADISARSSGLRKILIALDGSRLAERILEPALALGEALGSEFELILVIEPLLRPMDPGVLGTVPDTRDIEARLQREATGYLTRIAGELSGKGHRVAATHVVHAPRVAQALTDHAASSGCDLIALATHGAGGVKRLLVGSVADKVVRTSQHPVLVLRPQDPQS